VTLTEDARKNIFASLFFMELISHSRCVCPSRDVPGLPGFFVSPQIAHGACVQHVKLDVADAETRERRTADGVDGTSGASGGGTDAKSVTIQNLDDLIDAGIHVTLTNRESADIHPRVLAAPMNMQIRNLERSKNSSNTMPGAMWTHS
jgi:hypothetical protein